MFFLFSVEGVGVGVGSVGRLTGVDISATGFAHCLACWPPELTSPYRKRKILARSLIISIIVVVVSNKTDDNDNDSNNIGRRIRR